MVDDAAAHLEQIFAVRRTEDWQAAAPFGRDVGDVRRGAGLGDALIGQAGRRELGREGIGDRLVIGNGGPLGLHCLLHGRGSGMCDRGGCLGAFNLVEPGAQRGDFFGLRLQQLDELGLITGRVLCECRRSEEQRGQRCARQIILPHRENPVCGSWAAWGSLVPI